MRQWEVELTGAGEHRIQVDLRAPVGCGPCAKALSLAIPEVASTSLELDFSHRESDIIIGTNEDFGQKDLGDGKGTRLSAHLSPRSKLDVSWSDRRRCRLTRLHRLLTAQGEIAIDIDEQQCADPLVMGDPLCAGHGPEPGDPDRRRGRGHGASARRSIDGRGHGRDARGGQADDPAGDPLRPARRNGWS